MMDFTVVYFAIVGQNFGGVEQKIVAQFDALKKHTSDVVLYLVSSFPPKGKFIQEIDKRSSVKVLINKSDNVKNPFYRRKEKFHLISNALRQHNPINTIVYLRYPNSDFLLLDFFKANKDYKIVTEHSEIENRFKIFKLKGKLIESFFELLYGKNVRKRIEAFVGVTSEITKFEVKESCDPKKKAVTIGNGVDVQRLPMRSINYQESDIIKLLFVGGGYRHHGLDRIIKGIAAYSEAGNKTYKLILRIIGEGHEMDENKRLVKQLRLSRNVEFLTFKDTEELNSHFCWADIGVGSLGLHRIGLEYGSNLKAREYFSRGIPFFSSIVDEDLTACSKYVLKVAANDTDINMDEIIQFTLHMRSEDDHPEKMRRYAMSHLDWSIKMKRLLTFFESLYKSSTKPVL